MRNSAASPKWYTLVHYKIEQPRAVGEETVGRRGETGQGAQPPDKQPEARQHARLPYQTPVRPATSSTRPSCLSLRGLPLG